MWLPDVNVWLHAYRSDMAGHRTARKFVIEAWRNGETVAWSTTILTAVIRIATSPKVFVQPSTVEEVLAFCRNVIEAPSALAIEPISTDWSQLERLILETGTSGSAVTDAQLASLAISHHATFVTWDKAFKKFKGLRIATVEEALAEIQKGT